MEIKRIIIRGRCMIVFWEDGTKVTVKCSEKDLEDFEAAIAAAVLKKIFGSRNKVKEYIESLEAITTYQDDVTKEVRKAQKKAMKAAAAKGKAQKEISISTIDPKNMTKDEKQEACRKLHSEGMSYEQIGNILGISGSTAHKYINEKPKTPKTEDDKIDVDMMINLLNTPGWTTKDVAVEFGVSEQTIANRFYKHTGMKLGEWRKQQACK